MSLVWIPKSILEKTRKICANFLWSGRKEQLVLPRVKWVQIVMPKDMGGWGIKNINLFSKELVAKAGWRLLTTTILWKKVVYHKYISPVPLWDWIRNSVNITPGISSIIWKAICDAFPLIGSGLSWKVGNGTNVRIGSDPWPNSQLNHLLPPQLV